MCDSLPPCMTRNTKVPPENNLTQTSVSSTPVLIQFRRVDLFSVGARPSYKFRKTSRLWNFLISKLSNRTDQVALFFLNLHRIGCTVFLILCLIKLTRIHEDSNIHTEERRCSTCDVTHCTTKIHYLEDSVCCREVKENPTEYHFHAR